MNKIIGGLVILTLSAPAGIVATATSAEASGSYFSNCTSLASVFRHGVAKSRSAALYQTRMGYGMPAYGSRARNVYWTNYRRLDRDRDGTACER